MRIVKVGVVGAGAMGSGIAALAASAGIPVVLLDVAGRDDRDAPARAGLQRAVKAKPASFMLPERAGIVSIGNTDDHLERLADCDWVIEAIIEQPEPKRALYERLERVLRPSAIVSSNTSGIPIRSLVDGRSEAFRRRFLGTHFFNPPRYLHLLELIPTADTSPEILATLRDFGERHFGKGVVIAKDVPGFIANRLGLFGLLTTLRLMEQHELSIDEVDALTGTFIGRPRSATFRTGDISGIDVLSHVAAGLGETTGEDFSLPAWVHELVKRGQLGEKTGAGFYRKVGKDIHTLDWRTLEYRPAVKPTIPELAFLDGMPLAERLHGIIGAGGRHAAFLRTVLLNTSHYTLSHAQELATDISSVDRAMEWGYGWELGPFKVMDAIGLPVLRAGFRAHGMSEPPLLAVAQDGFYRHLGNGTRQLTFSGQYAPVEEQPDVITLSAPWIRSSALEQTDDAAIIDLGGGVLLLEFRSKMNTLGEGVLRMIDEAIQRVERGGYVGLVIGNDDPRTFTAGFDLSLVMRHVAEGNWQALERGAREFQRLVMSLRQVPYPVVLAPFGLTLGGGAEMALHASHVQAHAELYMGLVEVGVGLIPGGCGTKELLFRFTKELEPYEEADPFEAVKRAFKLIAMATTSTSALEARKLGFLRESDGITMHRGRLVADAKARVQELAPGFLPPLPRTIRALGKEGIGNLEYAAWAMHEAGYASEHDLRIAGKVAYVLCGGDGSGREVSEQDILDLEREAFLSLLGTKETQERIVHMLKTGKPLRN